jgi:hypothetical protein
MDDELLLEACIDTYRMIILDDTVDEIIAEKGSVSLLFDIDDLEGITIDNAETVMSVMLSVFQEEEHYEKCQDIMDFLNEI